MKISKPRHHWTSREVLCYFDKSREHLENFAKVSTVCNGMTYTTCRQHQLGWIE